MMSSPATKCALLLAGLVLGLLPLSACGGSDSPSSKAPVSDRLAAAKKTLDETKGVTFALAADDLPSGVSGVLKASGELNHQPAFKGKITVVQSGLNLTVDVVGVDGKTYIKYGLWQDLDPAQYGAPEPGTLLDPADGLSSFLTSAKDTEAGKDTRDGKDISSTITGTLSGDVVSALIPTAVESGEFEATFTLNQDDTLTRIKLTGPFYSDADDVTYTVDFSDYGESTKITEP